MKLEFSSMLANNVWALVYLPPNKKAISTKWVFTQKFNEEGKVSQFKARLVARGFSQIPGEDFDQTFAPVVKMNLYVSCCALQHSETW